MDIRQLTKEDKAKWNEFVEKSPWATVLQLWEWGESKKAEGWEPLRIAVLDEKAEIITAVQLLQKSVGFLGNYLYAPHGPVFQSVEALSSAIEPLVEKLKTIAKQKNAFCVEIEPMLGKATESPSKGLQHYQNQEALKSFLDNGFVQTSRNMQPKYKLFYDLHESDEEIMARMKKNTRYNVRYAGRKGVKVEKTSFSDQEADTKLDRFYKLLELTQKRAQGYPIRPRSSFEKLVESFKGSEYMRFMEASFSEDLIASNITQTTKFWASSFYGASNRKHSKMKATYLLRWEAVQLAKEKGCEVYDFWGYIPNDDQHSGYSDNKLSFGGTPFEMQGILALPVVGWKFMIWNIILPLRVRIFSLLRLFKR